jgi:hypothetical protein
MADSTSPAPITTLEDLLNRVEERLIPEGSTVHISTDRPDLQTKLQIDEVQDVLTAYRVKLSRDSGMPKDAITVDLPAGKSKPAGPTIL